MLILQLKIFRNIRKYLYISRKKAHELILFYSIEISDENYQEEYKVIDDHGETIANGLILMNLKIRTKYCIQKKYLNIFNS